MAFVKKLALGSIFISILCIFAMSHNANAMNLNYENFTLHSANTFATNSCYLHSGQTSSGRQCSFTYEAGQMKLKGIYTSGSSNYKAGDIIEYYLLVFNTANYDISGGVLSIFSQAGVDGLLTLDVEVVDDYSHLDFSVSSQNLPGENVGFVSDFWTLEQVSKVYKITQRVPLDGSYRVGLDVNNTSSYEYIFSWYQQVQTNNSLAFQIRDFKVWRPAESKENKEVEEKTQEAVDDSQAAGSDSSSAASSGGASLLTAITGFFNVITSAQPTNCRFNAPLNTYFGNQRLNVDLCSLELPSGIGTLTSIIAICIIIPFAIHMFNKFIALFRSFQS